MKVLVTGSAGFIGFHLVNLLLKVGYEVIGIDNLNSYYDRNLKIDRLKAAGIEGLLADGERIENTHGMNYSFVRLDITDMKSLKTLFIKEKFDVVCNLAAQAGVRYSLSNPQEYIDSNIQGFMNILECCRHHEIKHLVYASSSSVYGLNKQMPFSTHSATNHPVSLYAASKKSNELMAHTYSHLFGLPTTGLRFFTVYGSWGRPDMAIFLFTKAIFEGKPINVFNNGNMRRDFTHVNDIVNGICKVITNIPRGNLSWDGKSPDAASSTAPYRVLNIGRGKSVPLLDFIKTIEVCTGLPAQKVLMPLQDGDVEETWADVSDLIKDYDYAPTTEIEAGIADFISWYKVYYNS